MWLLLPGSSKTYLVDVRDVSSQTKPGAGGTVTPNVATTPTSAVLMPAGNVTIANPTNAVTNNRLVLTIQQDAMGSRAVTWGNKFPAGIVLSKASGAVDVLDFVYNGSTWLLVANARVA